MSEIISRVSWGAIWAGVMIALGLELLMTLFGLFIGFGMYNSQAANPWAGITPWTTAWYLITAAVSMFVGAWCAARLSGNPVRGAGILHGLATWGLATIATVAIIGGSAWSVMQEGVNVLSHAAVVTTEAMTQSPQAATAVPRAAQQANRAATEMEQNAGRVAQATANSISRLSLGLWIGVLVGFIAAIIGGWLGRARTVLIQGQQIAVGPTRLAA